MIAHDYLTAEEAACEVDRLRAKHECGVLRLPHWSGPICTLYLDREGELHLVGLEQPADGAA